MTNEEKVRAFKQRLDKMTKTYFIAELCCDAVIVAAVVTALYFVLAMDNHTALMVVVLVALVLFLGSSFVLTRLFFGSMQGLTKVNNFRTRYDFVTKNLADCEKKFANGKIDKSDLGVARTIHDDEIEKLASEIDSFTNKIKK